MSGNFRGVCPISNRATVIMNTVCAFAVLAREFVLRIFLSVGHGHCVDLYYDSENISFFGFYLFNMHDTHGCVLKNSASSPKQTKPKEAIQVAVNEKIRIKIKGYEHSVVDLAAAKIVDAAKRSGAKVSGPIPLPTDKEVITILRAVHKYKDSREQFEMRTHKRLIDVIRPTAKTTEALQNLELPAGVDIVMETK